MGGVGFWVVLLPCLVAAFFLLPWRRLLGSNRHTRLTRLPLYRELGFFRRHEKLTDEELSGLLTHNIPNSDAYIDFYLLAQDEERAWLLNYHYEAEGMSHRAGRCS